jgi:menaquinone-dependent protoporphyrinogen IX oxidase
MKAIVVFDSQYGNTRLVGEEIARGISEAGAVEVLAVDVEHVPLDRAQLCDLLVIGSPNHIGRATRATKRFIRALGGANLSRKKVAVFDTCFEGQEGVATREIEAALRKEDPGFVSVAPGLSVIVEKMKGPVRTGDLPRARAFGRDLVGRVAPSVPTVAA